MRAVDTNVIVRVIVADDPRQTKAAAAVLREGVYLPLTVLVEVAWVLESNYGISRGAVVQLLRDLVEDPGHAMDDRNAVLWALERAEAGADPADMLHLVASRQASSFATFDRALARKAQGSPVPVELIG